MHEESREQIKGKKILVRYDIFLQAITRTREVSGYNEWK